MFDGGVATVAALNGQRLLFWLRVKKAEDDRRYVWSSYGGFLELKLKTLTPNGVVLGLGGLKKLKEKKGQRRRLDAFRCASATSASPEMPFAHSIKTKALAFTPSLKGALSASRG
ncbi:hypothetical protein DVH24_003122 [Malus domestica]|uniref:Uncharacterized protein n=1 Tax=Malus domestica TaxID=3750 RepID=A0A498K9N6_MALDO|nr:hypothetical protein DVH24_003122 [Malus domestica]